MLAPHPITNKRARYACLKRKMKKRHQAQTIQDRQVPGLLTLLCLIVLFTILAYFRPN